MIKGLNKIDRPLVSVIIPAYNHECFIEEAIRSVWNQDYKNVELIVLNDGSVDATGVVIDKILNESPIHMKVIHKKNEGLCSTLNTGLELIRGEFISILASDDIMEQGKLMREATGLVAADAHVAGCYGDMRRINAEGHDLGIVNFRPSQVDDVFMSYMTGGLRLSIQNSLFRSSIVRSIGGFDERLRYEDYDFILRLLREYSMIYVGGVSIAYRRLPGGLARKVYSFTGDIELILDKHKHSRSISSMGRYGFRKVKSRIICRSGVHAMLNYDRMAARRSFVKSIAIWPVWRKPWLGLVATCIPSSLLHKMLSKLGIDTANKLRHDSKS